MASTETPVKYLRREAVLHLHNLRFGMIQNIHLCSESRCFLLWLLRSIDKGGLVPIDLCHLG